MKKLAGFGANSQMQQTFFERIYNFFPLYASLRLWEFRAKFFIFFRFLISLTANKL